MASRSRRPLLYTGLVALLLTPIALLILFGLGQTDGAEFSPDDFSRRSFSYNQIPILKWAIRKKSYVDTTSGIEQELIASKLITPIVNPKKTWHLTRDSGSGIGILPAECDARFLTGYLDLRDEDDDFFWSEWNFKFPEAAKVFWPVVAELARDEMYLKVSDVMEFAMELDNLKESEVENFDVTDFQSKLDEVVANVYFDLGSIDLELERFSRAKDRLTKSNKLRPSESTKQLLAKCMANLQAEASDSTAGQASDPPAEAGADQ